MPCSQNCVEMCFRKEDTPILLKPIPKHITTSAVLFLAPLTVRQQQTIFFLTIISQTFNTPGKFLQYHITCCCKQ